MNDRPLHRLRRTLTESWDQLATGWRHLWSRAGEALTEFTSDDRSPEVEHQPARNHWSLLSADVIEAGDQLELEIEVPGMDPGDFDLSINGQQLRIAGERHYANQHREGAYWRTERAYGRFVRTISLPAAVQPDGAKASYRNGILRIEIPKASGVGPNHHRIRID